MVAKQTKGNVLHKTIKQLAKMSFFSSRLAGRLADFDKLLLRVTGNRYSFTSVLSGLPIVVLMTTGAKSGRLRTTPLAAVFEDEKIILIASNFGSKMHPAWYYNLKANPQAKITRCGVTGYYLARELEGEEREYFWRKAVELYSGYARYQARAGSRKIPVISMQSLQNYPQGG